MNSEQCVDQLNVKFEIAEVLTFELGAGGFIFARLNAAGGVAEVCLHGGHVTSFVPTGQEPVLWMSSEAVYCEGKAIRGGVPVCWPWFSAHPTDGDLPSHGFARISEWEVLGSEVTAADEVRLVLGFELPDGLACELAVTVSDCLDLKLTTKNGTGAVVDLSAALHSYFCVGDVARVKVLGLDGVEYLDDVDALERKLQVGAVVIEGEVDRRYEGTTGDVLIEDESMGRTLRISKSGSATTVVWNPWSNRAAEIGDMPDDGFRTMLCVEAANVGADSVKLAPGESQVLGTTVRVV